LHATAASAQSTSPEDSAADGKCDVDSDADCVTPVARTLSTIGDYVTSPLRWKQSEWLEFGVAAAAIGVSHAEDTRVRDHFVGSATSLGNNNPHTVQDALPAAALFVGTWGYAHLIGDHDGIREAGTMVEAGLLSVGAAYIFNIAAGRQGPDQTTHVNRWWSGGRSFPSEHTTAAFAIGTVLAESGNDDYRWIRRVLGYGVGGFTLYQRMSHNAHWLSDGVAGAALGAASAQFAMDRRDPRRAELFSHIGLAPLPGGWMLSYSMHLP
jgi:membrane-associated phospholipid phosphatase